MTAPPGGAAWAAPAPEPKPGAQRPSGPGAWPPSSVLAADPATVEAPDAVAVAATCPTPSPGVHRSAPGSGKTVALTFDDGPGASTAAIVAILEDAGVAATFLNIGVNSTVRPALVRAEATQGFLLGNHTWSHPDMTTLSAAAQASEMDKASAEQNSLVGYPPCFFRPPYGQFSEHSYKACEAMGLQPVYWSAWGLDWEDIGPDRIADLVVRDLGPGAVVVLHDSPRYADRPSAQATAQAIPAIAAAAADQGLKWATLTQVLGSE